MNVIISRCCPAFMFDLYQNKSFNSVSDFLVAKLDANVIDIVPICKIGSFLCGKMVVVKDDLLKIEWSNMGRVTLTFVRFNGRGSVHFIQGNFRINDNGNGNAW